MPAGPTALHLGRPYTEATVRRVTRYVLGTLESTRNAVSGAAVDFGHGAVLNPGTNNLGTVAITRTAGLSTADLSFG